MLKSSKRMIKLPHGSLNIVDVPREVPLLPPVQIEYHSVLQNVKTLVSIKYVYCNRNSILICIEM